MIVRAHRIFKPPHIPAEKPCDLLASIHFFQAKEKNTPICQEYVDLPRAILDRDIPAATAQKPKELAPIMATLRERNITYRWGFPTKLIVTFQGKSVTTYHLKQGLKQLQNWGLSPPPLATPSNGCMATGW